MKINEAVEIVAEFDGWEEHAEIKNGLGKTMFLGGEELLYEEKSFDDLRGEYLSLDKLATVCVKIAKERFGTDAEDIDGLFIIDRGAIMMLMRKGKTIQEATLIEAAKAIKALNNEVESE